VKLYYKLGQFYCARVLVYCARVLVKVAHPIEFCMLNSNSEDQVLHNYEMFHSSIV